MDSYKFSWMKKIYSAAFLLISLLFSSALFCQHSYRVRRGDTLWRISRKFSINQSKLKLYNHLKSTSISPGMVLKIPGHKKYKRQFTKKSRVEWYKVRKGDTIWSICRRFAMTKKKFLFMNRSSSSRLYRGQRVKVYGTRRRVYKKKTRKWKRRNKSSFKGRWRWYRVRRGDSLWGIARKYKKSVRRIRQINKKSLKVMKKNQLIKVPVYTRSKRGKWRRRRLRRRRRRYRKKRRRRRRRTAYFGRIPRSRKVKLSWPVRGRVVASFGVKRKWINNGITIKTVKGKRVRASQRGIVAFSGYQRGYGKMVIIRHSNNIYTVYTNLKMLNVRKNMSVSRGRVIGRTGWVDQSRCFGLHYQIYYKKKPVNPLYYLG